MNHFTRVQLLMSFISWKTFYCHVFLFVFSVVVATSPSPVPSVNNTGHVTDWFDSLAECLQWNVRKEQKNFK